MKVNYKEEKSNKKVIAIICGALLLIGIIVLLVLLLNKKEKPEEPKAPDNKGGDVVVTEPVEEIVVKPTTVSNTTEQKKTVYRTVTFYYGDKSHTVKVIDGKTVGKYVPTGYTECEYYTDAEYETVFDFNTKIYIKSLITNYTIVYNMGNHGNPTEYSVDLGEIYLDNPSVDGVFLGWYLDEEHNTAIGALDENIVNIADENDTVYLYGYVTDKVVINYYDREGNKVTSQEVTSNGFVELEDCDEAADEGERVLGFSEDPDNTIEVDYVTSVALTDEEMSLYVVTGVTRVDYVNNDELVEAVGYNEEELDNYVLPTEEDLELEAPIYYEKVEDETLDSLLIVENDKEEVLDTEIKLSDVEGHTGDWYTPQVGDNVVEKEMTFDGWVEQRYDSEANEIVETKVEADYTPPVNDDVVLIATWTIEPDVTIES